MNTRARVKAVPALVAASIGLSSFGKLSQVLAHDGHDHGTAKLQPTGFEEINLTIEEAGVVGMPETLEAGRYLVKVTGPAGSADSVPPGALFVQLPEGIDAAQAFEDTKAAEGAPPEWYLDAHFGGGVSLDLGTENWGVIEFTAGNWIVTTISGTTLGVEFEVTGELASDLAAPESNVTLDLIEMSIMVKDGAFVAGENVIEVVNSGAQLHFVDVGKVPDGTTDEQVEALFESFMTGTPVAGGLEESDLQMLFYIPEQSAGTTQWNRIDLEPGTYFLSCWAPDPESMMPHAMMGMWELVDVE